MVRFKWFAVVGAMLLVVAGCSDSPPRSSPATFVAAGAATSVAAPASGVAHMQTAEGLLTVDLASGKSTFLDGLVNADWTRVASVSNGVARIVDVESREEVRTANVPEGLQAAAISADGSLVAYSDAPEYGLHGLPKGRPTTRVATFSAMTSTLRVLDLAGNYVPEAFSTDGRHLFLLDYVPAAAPDHYEVRMVDLVTGAMTDVGGRPKDVTLAEQMQGNVRTSLYSPNRQMLFTLYSQDGEEGKAFIHAVNLHEKWSYCIDLPDSGRFGDGQATMAMASDDKLYVIGDSGQIAQIDAQPYGLTVERSVQLPAATPAKNRPTAAVESNRLIIGHDERVFFVDRSTLRVDRTVTLTGAVAGLTGDGQGRLAIATPGAIEVFEQPAHTRVAGFDMKLPVIVRFDLE